jgi:di/tricarboxylate transporter
MEMWIVTAILVIVIILLIVERISIDVTAIGIMVALMLTGILTPAEAVAGFANPAVITVGAMFLISQAMIRTGVVGYIGHRVLAMARGRATPAIVVLLLIAAVASAFMNNTPVVVLFIPVIMSLGCRFGLSPSRYLIPLSYVSILAGTCTLIGTSTNIIISDLAAGYGFGTIGMFELARVGLPLAIIGFAFVMLSAPYLMPDLHPATCELENGGGRRFLAEITIPEQSRLMGKDPCADLPARYAGIEVLELIRHSHIYHPCRDTVRIQAGDLLLIKGAPSSLMALLDDKGVELPMGETGLRFSGPDASVLVELIVTPTSALVGQHLEETELARADNIHIIAIERTGLHYAEKQMRHIRLRNGDILLIWCRAAELDRLRGRGDWIVAEEVQRQIVHKRKAPLTAAIFGAMVAAAATGLTDIMTAALTAVFLMLVSGCLPLKQAYKALQGQVLLLIAGTIALGAAMQKTGTSHYYAELYLNLLDGWSPIMILGAFILLTSISTQILSNNATAVLLLPIAISTAQSLGVDPKSFIMAVVFGASASFATPIGYQTNLLVYGPGGYRFGDFLKMGIPLNLLVLIGGTLLIPIFWPL